MDRCAQMKPTTTTTMNTTTIDRQSIIVQIFWSINQMSQKMDCVLTKPYNKTRTHRKISPLKKSIILLELLQFLTQSSYIFW